MSQAPTPAPQKLDAKVAPLASAAICEALSNRGEGPGSLIKEESSLISRAPEELFMLFRPLEEAPFRLHLSEDISEPLRQCMGSLGRDVIEPLKHSATMANAQIRAYCEYYSHAMRDDDERIAFEEKAELWRERQSGIMRSRLPIKPDVFERNSKAFNDLADRYASTLSDDVRSKGGETIPALVKDLNETQAELRKVFDECALACVFRGRELLDLAPEAATSLLVLSCEAAGESDPPLKDTAHTLKDLLSKLRTAKTALKKATEVDSRSWGSSHEQTLLTMRVVAARLAVLAQRLAGLERLLPTMVASADEFVETKGDKVKIKELMPYIDASAEVIVKVASGLGKRY